MDICINYKGGGLFTNIQPVFSLDGDNIFVCRKNVILEYNTKTGKLLFEYKGFLDQIVGFNYQYFDDCPCLIACSESGQVIIWKVTTHFKLFEKKLSFDRIQKFYVIQPNNDAVGLKALVAYLKEIRIYFSVINIHDENKWINIPLSIKQNDYFFLSSGNHYFALAHENYLNFVRYEDARYVSRTFIDKSRKLTCISCHTTEEMVLTGDTSGRVLLWQNIFAKRKTFSIYHWHTLPVKTVCFSTSGSYFYSGGDECVLVKWQLENDNDKRFIPRIGSEINHVVVSSNNIYVAVATNDNAVRLFDSSLNYISLIQHLVLGKHYQCGIIYDPRTKSLLMNGAYGQVQFYSPDDLALLYTVDIVGQNRITNERGCEMINTEITRVAISKCGIWLASVEERKDDEYHFEIRLKFWKFDETNQIFELNTSIEYPHEYSVNNILFQPSSKASNLRCVTVGNDEKFKIWQLEQVVTVYKTNVIWKSFAVGYYRNLKCSSLSFSVDGSLIGVGFGHIVTTWVPDTCELKCSLTHPLHHETIKQLQFGYGSLCHLLVAVSTFQLSVWNILTLSMIWTVPIPISTIVADPLSTYIAALTLDNRIFVFTPASPQLIYSNDNLLQNYNIVATSFVPSKFSNDGRLKWYERAHIYFLTSNGELYCLSGSDDSYYDGSQYEDQISEPSFSVLQPHTKSNKVKQVETIKHIYEKDVDHKVFKKYLEGPLQTMAPIRFTCYSLIKSLVLQKEVT